MPPKRKYVPYVSTPKFRGAKKKARTTYVVRRQGKYDSNTGVQGVQATGTLNGGWKGTFPSSLFCKFAYNSENTLSSSSGATATHTFRLNSLFDPDASGVGGQPRYFDTLCGATSGNAPYGDYRVHAARVIVDFQSSSSPVGLGDIWVTPYTSAGPLTALDARENPKSFVKTVNTLGTGANSRGRIQFTVKMKDMFNVKDLADNPFFSAIFSANPVEAINMQIAYADSLGGSTAVLVRTTIIYYAQLMSLNLVASS